MASCLLGRFCLTKFSSIVNLTDIGFSRMSLQAGKVFPTLVFRFLESLFACFSNSFSTRIIGVGSQAFDEIEGDDM